MARRRFTWRGDQVKQVALGNARRAIDETTAACVHGAKSDHRWQNRTGTLEGSLQMRPATIVGSRVRGRWGSFDVNYAIYLELRWGGRYRYLFPQADLHYPRLAARLRQGIR